MLVVGEGKTVFEGYEDHTMGLGDRQKRLNRENTIRSMMMAAYRVDCLESSNVTYDAIKEHHPYLPPRQRAMVRSIAVNKGIVDDAPLPNDEW